MLAGTMMDAHATTVISLVGDIDGFGGQTAAGAVGEDTYYHFDNTETDDPYFTDAWMYRSKNNRKAIKYSHDYDLDGATALSATLTIMESGMSDTRIKSNGKLKTKKPWKVYFNSQLIGIIADGLTSTSTLHTFVIALSLLESGDGDIRLKYKDKQNEGFAIDYSLLSIEVAPLAIEVAAVPIPPALPLFGSGIAFLGFMGWRRKKRNAA